MRFTGAPAGAEADWCACRTRRTDVEVVESSRVPRANPWADLWLSTVAATGPLGYSDRQSSTADRKRSTVLSANLVNIQSCASYQVLPLLIELSNLKKNRTQQNLPNTHTVLS